VELPALVDLWLSIPSPGPVLKRTGLFDDLEEERGKFVTIDVSLDGLVASRKTYPPDPSASLQIFQSRGAQENNKVRAVSVAMHGIEVRNAMGLVLYPAFIALI